MNDLATVQPAKAPVPISQARADKVRETLARIRSQFLAVFDDWDRAQIACQNARLLEPHIPQLVQPRTEEERAQQLARLDAALAGQPTAETLSSLRADAEKAIAAPAVPKANRLIVATMVAAFPNVRPHSPETYLEALIEALTHTGFPPAVIAKTCNEVYTGSTFAPTVAEVLEKATAINNGLSRRVWFIDRYQEVQRWTADVRRWLEAVPLLAEDRSNTERPPQPHERIQFHPSASAWR